MVAGSYGGVDWVSKQTYTTEAKTYAPKRVEDVLDDRLAENEGI